MIVSQRAEHEIYLPAFWAATKQAHASSVMCSYSTINGQYACENDYLLHQTLDQRWKFPGFVTSDYGATHSTVASADAGNRPGDAQRRVLRARRCRPPCRRARSAWPR